MIRFFLERRQLVWFITFIILGTAVGALFKLPVQLLPDISKPSITVINEWPSASAQQIEREIVEPMERQLATIDGVGTLQTMIYGSIAYTTIDYRMNTDMNQAFVNVVSQLNQQNDRPPSTRPPIIFNGASGNRPAIASLLLYSTQNQAVDDITFVEIFENMVKPRLQQINGIGKFDVDFNPTDLVMNVVIDSEKLAYHGLNANDIINKINGFKSITAGTSDIGVNRFTVKLAAQLNHREIEAQIISIQNGFPVRFGDVAKVEMGTYERVGEVFWSGHKAFYFRINPAEKGNTLDIISDIKSAIDELNDSTLKGTGLKLDLSRDNSKSIKQALSFVKSSLIVGVLLATLALLLFVRNWRTLAIIFCSIPISMACTVIVMYVLGRNINIISLASIALSSGLIIDAAIIVLEAMRRRDGRQLNVSDIAQQIDTVKLPLMVSVITSIVVLIPLVFGQSMQSQLFEDIALTISVTLLASLFTALIVIPAIYIQFGEKAALDDPLHGQWQPLSQWCLNLNRTRTRQLLIIITLILLPVIGIATLQLEQGILPKAKTPVIKGYVEVNGVFNPASVKEKVTSRLLAQLEKIPKTLLEKYLLIQTPDGGSVFLYPKDPQDIEQLMEVAEQTFNKIKADYTVYLSKDSLLRFSLPKSDSLFIDLKGSDDKLLIAQAKLVLATLNEKFLGIQAWSTTPLELTSKTISLTPKYDRMALANVSITQLQQAVTANTDGLYIGNFFENSRSYDVFVKTPQWSDFDKFLNTPLAVNQSSVYNLSHFVDVDYRLEASVINRIDLQKAITIEVQLTDEVSMDQFRQVFASSVIGQVSEDSQGLVSTVLRTQSGTLDSLLDEIFTQFIVACVFLFLLMATLFRSFKDSLLVLLSLPVSIFGACMVLYIANWFTPQRLDILTLVGFIILIGLVINNAILLMSQYRQKQNQGISNTNALEATISDRIQPILMSSITSIVGMLPLALSPAMGAEIYRGLALVIMGGMIFSTPCSILLIPTLIRLSEGFEVNRN
ncbi:efflux RND transporter permease subunit [uncultured Shewanella sp.]|uniref:efflux RND transporter permease subunit n=1 Tax=uncultured Shewanella sp. TaxID=173975 RepID=UPI0026186195|nr:efflux RND transporter permease subunit [uncultured Shewanella sp.]